MMFFRPTEIIIRIETKKMELMMSDEFMISSLFSAIPLAIFAHCQ
jgi:hypothetical protein